MKRTFIAVACTMLFVGAAAGQPGVTARIMPRQLVVDPQTNTAAGIVLLQNDSDETAQVMLVADDFVPETHIAGMGARTLFAVGKDAATPELQLTLAARSRQNVRIEISKLGHAGIARSTLMNHGSKLADLVAVRTQVPFNVAPVDWKDGTPYPIRFEQGGGPVVHLKNDDPLDYLVRWSLSAPGLEPKSSTDLVRVPAQSTKVIQIPVADWLPSKGDMTALLKNLSCPGSLRLVATDRSGGAEWKTRDLPVVIERSHWSEPQQDAGSFLVLALLVGLGGLMSIIVTHGLPNRLRRISVTESIKSITPKIRAITTAVQSNLRTGVRVERTRLLQRLRSRSTISPDFASLAAECERSAQLLDREIDLIDRIDAHMRRIETIWPTVGVHGPTLLETACGLLSNAQIALDRPEVDETVVGTADALVRKAEATIDNATILDEPSMASVKSRLDKLEKAGELKTCEVAKKIIAEVPGLAEAMQMKAADLKDSNFAEFDTGSAKLEFVRRFVEICETVKGSDEKTKCIEQFIVALRRASFNDFRTAAGLTEQMRERTFSKQVTDEIIAGRYRIEIEPQAPTVNQAVSFTVVFDKPDVNTASARHAVSLTWKFHHAPAPDHARWIVRAFRWVRDKIRKLRRREIVKTSWQVWTEEGLSVSHYFPTAGLAEVTIHFRDDDGQEVKSGAPARMDIIVAGERAGWFGERTKVEYLKLAIVLVITVAGLLTGARDELAKLDVIPGLIGVFMLGFTADQIKNILAPPASS